MSYNKEKVYNNKKSLKKKEIIYMIILTNFKKEGGKNI